MLRDEVISAQIPGELGQKLTLAAKRIERTKSWIIREALAEWLSYQARRDEMESEALNDPVLSRKVPYSDLLLFPPQASDFHEDDPSTS